MQLPETRYLWINVRKLADEHDWPDEKTQQCIASLKEADKVRMVGHAAYARAVDIAYWIKSQVN